MKPGTHHQIFLAVPIAMGEVLSARGLQDILSPGSARDWLSYSSLQVTGWLFLEGFASIGFLQSSPVL